AERRGQDDADIDSDGAVRGVWRVGAARGLRHQGRHGQRVQEHRHLPAVRHSVGRPDGGRAPVLLCAAEGRARGGGGERGGARKLAPGVAGAAEGPAEQAAQRRRKAAAVDCHCACGQPGSGVSGRADGEFLPRVFGCGHGRRAKLRRSLFRLAVWFWMRRVFCL
ncbi:hypothetical protein HDU83_000461, partial [Entophlyctis luteolus]